MNYENIEYVLVLAGWVIGLLLGMIFLAFKTPQHTRQAYYNRGKRITGIIYLLFGFELLFQWLLRFYLELNNPIVSVTVYLFTYCAATLLITTGFCILLAPRLLNKRQYSIIVSILAVYTLFLLGVNLLPTRLLQVKGIIVVCAILFIINSVMIYKCIMIYRKAIHDLRTYYSDILDNLIRWMPGVGFGVMLLLIAAPITCLAPREVGIYQLALGIFLMIYTFLSIINFYFRYDKVAVALSSDESFEVDNADDIDAGQSTISLSESLCAVLQEKEKRWKDQGRFRQTGITIDQVAHEMGTNRNYLSRYLNEVKNMTFYEWVAQMRIQEAQSLMLAHPEASIEQISTQVGFTSHSTFSSTFKKITGMSPLQWRNRR